MAKAKHDCAKSPESCYRHQPYSVHPVFGGGFQVYDPAYEIYVRQDGKAFSDGHGRNNWSSEEQAQAVANRLNKRDSRF